MREANPKAYLIFYDNFLKIAAGQVCWKKIWRMVRGKFGGLRNTSGESLCITVPGE
jgi:hypothetical protein